VGRVQSMLNAESIKAVLWDFDQHLRSCVKYGVDEKQIIDRHNKEIEEIESLVPTPEPVEPENKIITGYIFACDELRAKLWELMREYDIKLYE
jgi:hypothetical protein